MAHFHDCQCAFRLYRLAQNLRNRVVDGSSTIWTDGQAQLGKSSDKEKVKREKTREKTREGDDER